MMSLPSSVRSGAITFVGIKFVPGGGVGGVGVEGVLMVMVTPNRLARSSMTAFELGSAGAAPSFGGILELCVVPAGFFS